MLTYADGLNQIADGVPSSVEFVIRCIAPNSSR